MPQAIRSQAGDGPRRQGVAEQIGLDFLRPSFRFLLAWILWVAAQDRAGRPAEKHGHRSHQNEG